MLKCSNGRYYVGCTENPDRRMDRHDKGFVHYARDKRPLECIAVFGFQDKHKAFAFEKYLKTGSGRAFMNRHLVWSWMSPKRSSGHRPGFREGGLLTSSASPRSRSSSRSLRPPPP
ncbi:MAG: GIY-YIG nuclease family protein [Flavobacteriales bacterium]|nr:GIY-YIG nuclease family protein [Flavobacteriales bacterium]